MFYALSENKNYLSDKIDLFIALGPVITINHAHDKFIGSTSKHEK